MIKSAPCPQDAARTGKSEVKSQYIYILNPTECIDNYQKIKFEFLQLYFVSDRITFNRQYLYHL